MTEEQKKFWEKWKYLFLTFRLLATVALFHKQLGWPTLPFLLILYEYYFIGMNIFMTVIAGTAIAFLVSLVHKAPNFDRVDFEAVEQETLLANPVNSLMSMFIVVGIWQFGHSMLSVAYFAALALMEMTQTYYIHMMRKVDEAEVR